MEDLRRELAQRDSGLAGGEGKSETRDPKDQEGQKDGQVGEGTPSHENNPRAEEGESELDRLRAEIKERYQSGDEENPGGDAVRHVQTTSGSEQQEAVEWKPAIPEPAEAHGRQKDSALPDAEQTKGCQDDAAARPATASELQHPGGAPGHGQENDEGHEDRLPTDAAKNSHPPVSDHPEESEAGLSGAAGVGGEIRGAASDSALADRPQLAEPRDAMDMEVPETVVARTTQEDLHGPHASEVLPDAPDTLGGKVVVETASSPADKADKTRSDPRRPLEQPENDKHEAGANRGQRTDKVEAAEPLATFSATALDGPKRFQIETKVFEEKTGVKLEKGKTVAISGDIEGVGEFRKLHMGGSKGEYFPIYPPRDRRDSIVVGDKYNVHVRSVEVVSRSPDRLGTFYLTPYLFPGGEGKLRFDLTTSSLEKRTGVKLEEGKTYDVKVKIGLYIVDQKHTAHNGNPHIFIWVPKEHAAEFKLGEKHELTVISVTEQRTLATVPKSEVRTKLLLQARTLESLGVNMESMRKAKESDRFLDVTLKKVAPDGDESTRRVFGKFEPQRSVLLLNIADVGGQQGDTYEILRAEKLTMESFVNDFNAYRGKGFGNMSLSLEGSKLVLNVDQKSFEAKSYSLDVNRLRAFLRAEFEPYKSELSFWFDGQAVSAKYDMGKPIIAFSTSAEGFEMVHPARRQDFAALQGIDVLQKDIAERLQTLQALRLIEEKQEVEGSHRFVTD